MPSAARIALIGDLHGSWDDDDVRAFNESDYTLLVFTGDLGSGTARNGLQIARSVSRLTKPAIVMPGNNDAPHLAEIRAEFGHRRGVATILDLDTDESHRHARVILCGYKLHRLALGAQELSLVTGRPCAMGGAEFSFPEEIAREYGVADMAQSQRRLVELVEAVSTRRLVVLGHNGPTGVGSRRSDLWGRDFDAREGDWGDPDLAAAVSRARERGLEVTVVAGHMHHRLRGGGGRLWAAERDAVRYINPARVPRIYEANGREARYHVALEVGDFGITATEIEWTTG